MTPSGIVTTLATFPDMNGSNLGLLTEGADGSFYGTTSQGGANGKGTIFKMTPSGTLTTLFNNDAKEPKITVQQPAGKDLISYVTQKDFGGSAKGKSGVTKAFTIYNNGKAKLSDIYAFTSSRQKRDFIISPLVNKSVEPRSATSFKVTFKPSGLDKRTTTLTIQSNDPEQLYFDIKLTGTGTKPKRTR